MCLEVQSHITEGDRSQNVWMLLFEENFFINMENNPCFCWRLYELNHETMRR